MNRRSNRQAGISICLRRSCSIELPAVPNTSDDRLVGMDGLGLAARDKVFGIICCLPWSPEAVEIIIFMTAPSPEFDLSRLHVLFVV